MDGSTERRDRIIDATMRLLADRPFEEVTVRAIAAEADVSLAALHAEFPTRGHIIAAFSRRIDDEVLAADTSDMADEAPRDRLFDVLMSRLDALRPYRAGIRSLGRAAQRDPALALALNAIAAESMGWMLAAARISAPGWRGRLAVQGLTVAFARVLRVFVTDDDPGLPRTMAKLDGELKEAERNHARFARVFGRAVRQDGAAPLAEPAAAAPDEPPSAPPAAPTRTPPTADAMPPSSAAPAAGQPGAALAAAEGSTPVAGSEAGAARPPRRRASPRRSDKAG
jgi:AcrR family transcriptional regulator